ncbi:hypothetical protein [Chryseobacterium luteum]|uniref:hypothetical protein n=1 Tax=Chryseobacterium luteum TaxID=421531 RepID=UPI00068E7824|nr:hypothetical protein [Chryseobacterium luteum]
MGWLIGNNKRAFAEKLMKDIRAREERENVDVIGDVSPEIQEKRASQNLQEKNSKKMQEVREEREKEDDKQEGQLLAIHGAKVKFNAHMGEFKVLNDVPTTQGKLTGTIVEKQIPNFTFYDGFQMLSLTKWQDFGTVNVQDNFALLKKSTLPGTGKMQGNVPPESGKIEFVDSGQVNVPESINTTGAPVPKTEKKIKIKSKQSTYTVVLDKAGALFAGFPILEFEIEDGIPNNFIDIQVVKVEQGLLTNSVGIRNSWDKTKLPKVRVPIKTFSSYTNGDTTLKLDASGKATYKIPLDWWRDLARQPLSQFTTMKIYFKVLSFQNPTAVKEKSLVVSVDVSNNLTSFITSKNIYSTNARGQQIKDFSVDFTVKEANTTEMYCFVQWKKGGRQNWDAGKNMTRPTTTGYDGNQHTSNYPSWTLDSGDLDPRYGDPTESSTFGSTKGTLIDKPSSGTPNHVITHTYTKIEFDTRIHLNFDVPNTLTGTDGITGIIALPEPLILANVLWESRILQIWNATTGVPTITHPATYPGP